MKKIATCLTLFYLLTNLVWSQGVHKNIDSLSHIPYTDICSDVVGYVAAGVEYAIVGHEYGTTILSLANPSSPTILQEILSLPTEWHELDVYQHYAYMTNEVGEGLRIIDLAGLPGLCAYKDTVIAGMVSGHTLMVSGDRLYVYGSNIDNNGASVYSLADPWNPVHIGAYTNTYVHDGYVRGDTCYFGEIYLGLLTMVDMRNPASPVVLGSVPTPSSFTHNTWLNDAGNICFTTDEEDAAYVTAYDVTDPNNMVEIDRYRSSLSNGQSVPHNVKVLNDFLVISYYKDGVNIVDAARPHNMIEVGYYDTNPMSGAGFEGNWGLECYLPSGHIVACDISEGVWVLDPTYIRACYLEGQVTDVTNGNPLPGATVTILSSMGHDIADFAGDYATGVADPGSYMVRYSKFGYRDSIITVTLANGVLETQNIALQPNARVHLHVQVLDLVTGLPIPNAGVVFWEISNQVATHFVADAAGQVIDTNFMASNYDLIAGRWAYLTSSIPANVNAPNNNLTISLGKGYYDDFTFDLGWTVNGNASGGVWERGEPIGTPLFQVFANPEEDVQGDYTDACYVTGNGGGGPFDDDVDNGHTIMTSPPMDLTSYQGPDSFPGIVFDYWFLTSTGNGQPSFKDSLVISIDNGIQTKKVWFKRDLQQFYWTTDTIILTPDVIAVTDSMRISISCGDILFDQVIEAAIDRVRITKFYGLVANDPAQATVPSLQAYPNPSQGRTYLRYDLQGAITGSIRILGIDGRELQRIDLTQSKGVVELAQALPAGLYIAILESEGQQQCTQKFIRNE